VVLSKECGILTKLLVLICINWKGNIVIFMRRGLMSTNLKEETCIRTMK
jgi:hypothetical protein